MDRDDLHELISLLKEEFEAGRVVIRSEDTLEALKRVRFAADGKIDPATVTSSVRAYALAVAAAVHERTIKRNTAPRGAGSLLRWPNEILRDDL